MNKQLIRRMTGVLSFVNRLIPKKPKKVVFYSNMGFRDNVKAVYDELLRHPEMKEYKIVCAVNDHALWEGKPHPENVRFTTPVKGVFSFLTGKYFFYSFGKYPIKPSPDQMVVNVWHGSPLKKIGNYESDEDQNFFTTVLAASDFFVPIMQKAFSCRKEQVVVCGHPRNDAMFAPGDPLETLGIPRYDRLILWLPTFRQSAFLGDNDTAAKSGTGLPILESKEEMEKVNAALKEKNALMLVKIHPAQDLSLIDTTGYSNLRVLTNDEMQRCGCDLYELLGVSDGLITDYSSVYFDYLLLDRPIGFTVDDIEEYRKGRGFVVDDPYPLMPGIFINTSDEFLTFIENLLAGKDEYAEKRCKVNSLVNKYPGGKDAERCLRLAGILSGSQF